MKRSVTRRLLREAKGTRRPLIVSALARIVGACARMAIFALGFVLVGCAVAGKAPRLQLGVALVITGLVRAGCSYLEHYSGHLVAFTMLAGLRVRLYAALAKRAPASISEMDVADVLPSAVRDIDRVEAFYAHTIVPRIAAVVVPVLAGAAVMQLTGFTAGLILCVGLWASAFALTALTEGQIARAKQGELEVRSELSRELTRSRIALAELLSNQKQDEALTRITNNGEQIGRALEKAERWKGVRGAVGLCWDAFLLITVAGMVASMQQSLPQTLAALGLAVGSLASATALREGGEGRVAAKESARRLFAMIDNAGEQLDGDDWQVGVAPQIVFDQVYFKYPKTERGLKGLTLTLHPGQYTCLSGPSGSGKSTIGALLARAWDLDKGGIIVDGIYLNRISPQAVRQRICVISQDGSLIDGTVADNLKLGKQVPGGALEKVLKVVALEEDVAALGGLQAHLRPNQLSGGQKQRLLLARGLLMDADAYVLDEVTSHLDEATLQTVRANLRGALHGKTVLEITHRVDTTVRHVELEEGALKA